ncbi:MAG: secretin N-terminal domain-containing protein [Candidatus Omnitrophota bacterium]|nr:secretin N-terminal domain-containing protein [Candidatus Omnitrophota bacterium]
MMARPRIYLPDFLFLILLCAAFCGRQARAEDGSVAAPSAPSIEVKQGADKNTAAKSGDPDNVTFDFKDADIQNVLKIISYKSGVNIISSPDVTGVVSIRLVNVPWEEALDAILSTHNFGYEWINDKIIMVGSLEKLSLKKKARLEERSQEKKIELEEKKASLEISARENKDAVENLPLDTQAFVLNFSKADEIKTAVQNLISARGKIMLEPRTNTLIITDSKANLAKIEEIIKKLDRMTPQVLIEAKIIETTLGNAEKLGIDWTLRITARGASRPITWPYMANAKGVQQDYLPLAQSPSTLERTTTSQTDAQTGNIINTTSTETLFHKLVNGFPEVPSNLFTFGTLNFTEMAAVMEILAQRTDSKILSNPRIVTLNNREAKILVGSIVPIPNYEYSKDTGTRVVSGYTDQEIGVGLSVIPNINERDYITLNVRPTIDQIIGYTGPNNERPIISTRNAETNVMIKDGQTLVIGGLISEKKTKYKKKIPILGDIPGLDFLFSKKEDTIERTELLIFISPHIIREGDFREANLKETEKIEKEMLEDARLTLSSDKKDPSLMGRIKQVVKK